MVNQIEIHFEFVIEKQSLHGQVLFFSLRLKNPHGDLFWRVTEVGGCSLKVVNSPVYVKWASNNLRSTPQLLKDYIGHHKSDSGLQKKHVSVYLGKLLFLITVQICLPGNCVQTSGRVLMWQIPGTLIEADLPGLDSGPLAHILKHFWGKRTLPWLVVGGGGWWWAISKHVTQNTLQC